jgi:hypothetical protein
MEALERRARLEQHRAGSIRLAAEREERLAEGQLRLREARGGGAARSDRMKP